MRPAPEDRTVEELVEFGVVALDKPPGPSAHQVSAWVREVLEVEKAAHAGTLDPKVTGCLPTLLGTATRVVPALQSSSKTYVAVLELQGDPPADFEAIVEEFEGRIYQKPPRHSAVARELRVREIYELTVLERDARRALLRIHCEAGTYIRKLCHDIGLALGTGANMGDLRRTAAGPFDDTDLVTLHDLADALAFYEEDGDEGPIREAIQPAEAALRELPRMTIADSAAESVAHGAPVYAPGIVDADPADDGALVACYTPAGSAVCLGTLVGDPEAESGMVVDLERVLV